MNKVVDYSKLAWSKTNRWHRVIFIFLVVELKLVPGGHYGFYCNDPALSYPYTGDTISWKWLMAVCLLLPLIIMLIVERINSNKKKSRKTALRWYKEYLYGFILNLTIVQSLKLIIGSPRPHFFATCKPKEAENCKLMEFISSYTCTSAHWLNQSDRSFPSGHTSLAVHAAIFIAYYLHSRTRVAHARQQLGSRCVSTLCTAAAALCAASRLTDHRHHWWDVLGGAVIAAPVIYYTVINLCQNFACRSCTEEEKEIEAQLESNASPKETASSTSLLDT